MNWAEIEREGRKKLGLGDEFHLYFASWLVGQTYELGFSKKGPRGGWLKGKSNRVKGYVSFND